MSSFISPVGPQGPGVYWLRRALVVVAILATLLALRWLIFGRGEATSDVAASPSTSSSPAPATESAKPTPSVDATTPAGSTATPAPVASSGNASPQCANSDISVSVSTDAASYTVGSTPQLHLKIQNSSGTACYRDIGAGMNELHIKSGGYHVWSSDDCNVGGAPQMSLLAPAQSYSVTVTWPGVLSAKGCPANQPVAKGGSYNLYGRNGSVISAPAVFSLTN